MPAAMEAPPRSICHLFTPIGMLGYGFDADEANAALEELTGRGGDGDEGESSGAVPTAIVVDSGSTDSGPAKLALGGMTCSRTAYRRDLARLLEAVVRWRVPLLVGSAGGAGTDEHVETIGGIVREICAEEGYALSLVQIFAEVDKELVTRRLEQGLITGCSTSVPELTAAEIHDCPRIVAQMGPEPYLEVLRKHPGVDVIIGGRSYDPAPYVAFAEHSRQNLGRGGDARAQSLVDSQMHGNFMHAAKILECGGVCAIPKSAGALATLYEDGSFDIRPSDPSARCTPRSVASHTLYENARPDILRGPGGWLDVTGSTYEAKADGRTVRVRGSRYFWSVEQGLPYQIKLEAARSKGYRSIYMGCHKDPVLIAQIDKQMPRIKAYVRSQLDPPHELDWDIDWHIYGRTKDNAGGEVFLIGECRADTQELARAVAGLARTATVHADYAGQKATSGNLAFGIGGMNEIDLGLCSEFCIYHLMNVEAGEEVALFPAKMIEIGSPADRFSDRKDSEKTNSVLKKKSASAASVAQASSKYKRPPLVVDDTATTVHTLGDAANVLRSKNAGPYEVTFDVMFDSAERYELVKGSGLLTTEKIAELYDLSTGEVVWCGFFDPARSFKATIPRKRGGMLTASGGFMENDVHGSQMYLPLKQLKLPVELQEKIQTQRNQLS